MDTIFQCQHCIYVKNNYIFPYSGRPVLMTDNSTSEFDARLGLISSTDKAFGLKWTERKKKKSFKCRAMLKQIRASAKELEWRQDCFLPQSATTPKTNRSYFAETGQSQKNAWQRLHREQMNHSRMKIHQSMKVRLWLHRSNEVQFVCLLHASVLTTKRAMMMATKIFFFSFLHEL